MLLRALLLGAAVAAPVLEDSLALSSELSQCRDQVGLLKLHVMEAVQREVDANNKLLAYIDKLEAHKKQ